jgi:hypothetical protein
VQAHPEFPYITWDLKPESKGKLSVAKTRGGPLDIAWEVHGEGEKKMVVSAFFLIISFCHHSMFFISSFVLLSKEENHKDWALCSILHLEEKV